LYVVDDQGDAARLFDLDQLTNLVGRHGAPFAGCLDLQAEEPSLVAANQVGYAVTPHAVRHRHEVPDAALGQPFFDSRFHAAFWGHSHYAVGSSRSTCRVRSSILR
jgi:hypothetical protein